MTNLEQVKELINNFHPRFGNTDDMKIVEFYTALKKELRKKKKDEDKINQLCERIIFFNAKIS